MPKVAKFDLCLQKYINLINQALKDEQVNYKFIVGQLLLISNFLDYRDGIGRQQMFKRFKCFVIFFLKNFFLFIKNQKLTMFNIFG